MSEKITCKVNGIIGCQPMRVGRKIKMISAMCGKIKSCSNECSIKFGECEHQKKGVGENE